MSDDVSMSEDAIDQGLVDNAGFEDYTDAQMRAYHQLRTAGELMGLNNYRAGLAAHVKAGRKKHTYRYQVTEAHAEVVEAMSKVLGGSMTVEEANNLVNSYDVQKQRLGK